MKGILPHLEGKTHVIWDWNGTLLSDLDHSVKVANRLLKEENLPAIGVDDYKRDFRFPVVDYYGQLGFKTDPVNFTELCERFNRYFYEGLHLCDLWPGARETLREIHKSKTQSLLSASEHNMLLDSVKRFGVDGYFHNVFGIADKLAASKVARGQELVDLVRRPLAETILIGDTDHDLEVGKALGIDVILVEHGHQDTARLRKAHSRVLRVL